MTIIKWQNEHSVWEYPDYVTNHFRLALLEAAEVMKDYRIMIAKDFYEKYKQEYSELPYGNNITYWIEQQLRLSAGE